MQRLTDERSSENPQAKHDCQPPEIGRPKGKNFGWHCPTCATVWSYSGRVGASIRG